MDGAMRTPIFHLQSILDAFKRKKVLTKDEILQAAGCSTMTALRLLSQHGYFTSYNETPGITRSPVFPSSTNKDFGPVAMPGLASGARSPKQSLDWCKKVLPA